MVGIVGDKEKINKLIWCMITGIVVMHAPDEVKIGIVADKNQALSLEIHTMPPAESGRYPPASAVHSLPEGH